MRHRRKGCQFKMARRLPKQLALPAPPRWGGRRDGAERPSSKLRPDVPHTTRLPHDPRHPVHVTLRATRGLRSLRSEHAFSPLIQAFSLANGNAFRIVHFSIQTDHIHLIIEADSSDDLRRGLNSLNCRAARALNRAWKRSGPVWGDRYHARPLATPREVRNGLVYVLLNFRKHLRAPAGVDPCSSGAWFGGWSHDQEPPSGPRPSYHLVPGSAPWAGAAPGV